MLCSKQNAYYGFYFYVMNEYKKPPCFTTERFNLK